MWQKQAAGIFRELLHSRSHLFPAGSPLQYFPAIQGTQFLLLPSYSLRPLIENRSLKNLHLPVLALYNQGFRFHQRYSADFHPKYGGKSGSYLSVLSASDQTDEKLPSDEKHSS